MIALFIGLLIIAIAITYWGQLNNGEIHIAPILGLAIAFLYSSADIEEEQITEHTLQCCILIVSITVIWETPMTG